MSDKGYYNLTKRPAAIKLIDRLVEAGALSDSGRSWLEQYVDCVHWRAGGNPPIMAPSKTRSQGVVSSTTIVKSISQPGSLAGANWDMHIQWFSEMNSWTAKQHNQYQNFLNTPTGAGLSMGGVTMRAAGAGSDCGCFVSAAVDVSTPFGITSTQAQMRGRLVAMCIKYTDTTPPLYKGGMMHGYRLHEEDQLDPTGMAYGGTATATAWTPFTALPRKALPTRIDHISLLPSYASHYVADGAFTTVMIDPEIDASIPDYVIPVYQNVNFTNPYQGVSFAPTFSITGGGVYAPANFATPDNAQSHTGAVPGGFYLTGLNENHTGTLTITYVWESFPNSVLSAEANYVNLQQNSTEWDSLARRIAQDLLAKAPSMGMAADNDNWTWLAKTFGSIGGELADMIGMIPHPIAQGIAAGTKMASGVAKNYAEREKKKKGKGKAGKPAGFGQMPKQLYDPYRNPRLAAPPLPPAPHKTRGAVPVQPRKPRKRAHSR